jgi:hypothetical protein
MDRSKITGKGRKRGGKKEGMGQRPEAVSDGLTEEKE